MFITEINTFLVLLLSVTNFFRLFDNNFDDECAKVFFRALEENKKIQKLE